MEASLCPWRGTPTWHMPMATPPSYSRTIHDLRLPRDAHRPLAAHRGRGAGDRRADLYAFRAYAGAESTGRIATRRLARSHHGPLAHLRLCHDRRLPGDRVLDVPRRRALARVRPRRQ